MTIGNTNDSKKRHNDAVTRFYRRNRRKVLQYKKEFYYNKKFWINQPEKLTEEEKIQDQKANEEINEIVENFFKEI